MQIYVSENLKNETLFLKTKIYTKSPDFNLLKSTTLL